MNNIEVFEEKSPKIASDAWLHPQSIVIGDVTIGSQSSVWPLVTIRGDVHSITIGAQTNIQDGSVLHVSHDSEYLPGGASLTIGDGVTVGHKVILHGCKVGDFCLIGMGSIIMDRSILEPEVMLAAGSVVPGGKTLESGYLYRGSPAKQVRPLNDKELAFLHYSAKNYVSLSGRYKNK